MALITQGTTIKKVMSGGTEIKKVMSGGTVIWTSTVMRTITIPVITGVATQTLKIGSDTIYNGLGGAGVTVQVAHGSVVTLQATAATGYSVNVTSPVTANADFSTASYISAVQTFTISYPIQPWGTVYGIYKNGVAVVSSPSYEGSFSANYGDAIWAKVEAAEPFNNPTTTGISTNSGNPTIVTANITVGISAGSVKSYILTKSTITGVATQTVNRTSSPYGGGATGNLNSGATIFYGDMLTLSATGDTSNGYGTPSVTTPIEVRGSVSTNSYITANDPKTQNIVHTEVVGNNYIAQRPTATSTALTVVVNINQQGEVFNTTVTIPSGATNSGAIILSAMGYPNYIVSVTPAFDTTYRYWK